MDTKTFFDFYDLESTSVVSISDNEEGLAIVLNTHLEMQFIANGFRTEFDDYYYHRFTFVGCHCDVNLSSPIVIAEYKFDGDMLSFSANSHLIKIPNCVVKVEQNWPRE